ncbi:hypothetical protein EYZ11_003625 [Aspergillus tanneri]|uniref:Uncharacterized protein n=1 Tax=Aspergillus tanneri TaxID=1220188 RepID=A0A4S3JQ08_9EURO|nr:hypothetical protein EYZ11_003625 [Aspergillus tanneri]
MCFFPSFKVRKPLSSSWFSPLLTASSRIHGAGPTGAAAGGVWELHNGVINKFVGWRRAAESGMELDGPAICRDGGVNSGRDGRKHVYY